MAVRQHANKCNIDNNRNKCNGKAESACDDWNTIESGDYLISEFTVEI